MESGILVAYVVVLAVLVVIGFLLKGERFIMYQEATGKSKEVKRGFSFTYLFFGPFVPLFRGHVGGFFLSLFVELFTCGLAHLILLFCYNGMYINWLAQNGYRRMGVEGSSQGKPAPVNIQINAGNGQPVVPDIKVEPIEPVEPLAEKKKLEFKGKFPGSNRVLAPVQGQTGSGDDSETMMVKKGALIGLGGMYQGAELPIEIGETLTIGRDAEKSNLVIQEREISRAHCAVSFDPIRQCYTVTDYSTNGVYLKDGSQIAQGQPVYLYSGDTIRLGNTVHVFRLK